MFLDTNYLIENAKAGSAAAQRVDAWLLSGEPLHVSALAWAEYLCGPLTPGEEVSSLAVVTDIWPLGADAASLAAYLFNQTGRRRRSLPDCVIAATAILARQPLATLNPSDFQPFLRFGLTLA